MSRSPRNYYDFRYESLPRWSSYWYQIHEVLSLFPSCVLEIGVGNGVVGGHLRKSGISVTTLDIDGSLSPDVTASATKMPLQSGEFDVVLCAEVLEHLRFEDVPKALGEISRVTRGHAVVSMPHWGSVIAGLFKIPFIPWLRFVLKFPSFGAHPPEDKEHAWEMGRRGFPPARIRREFRRAGFDIVREYIIVEYPYHHFFVLKKR